MCLTRYSKTTSVTEFSFGAFFLALWGNWRIPRKIWNLFCRGNVLIPQEVDMRDTKERLSLFWMIALLNYLYADVLALFAFVGSPNSAAMGAAGFRGFDGNTHRHDRGVSTASV
jgi:hypothetical protein